MTPLTKFSSRDSTVYYIWPRGHMAVFPSTTHPGMWGCYAETPVGGPPLSYHESPAVAAAAVGAELPVDTDSTLTHNQDTTP